MHSLCGEVANEVADIWKKTKVPIIVHKSIAIKIHRPIGDYRNRDRYKSRVVFQRFVDDTNNLFDIARCKCAQIPEGCKCKDQDDKIPQSEIDFIFDQRGERLRSIGDREAVFIDPNVPDMPTESSDLPTTDMEPSSVCKPKRHYSVRRNLKNFAEECDRYNVHDRPAAAMASALLKDFEIKDDEGNFVVIDKSKVKRERFSYEQELLRRNRVLSNMKAFAFDSKKDRTLTQTRTEDGKLQPRIILETHITVLRQPSSVFLGYAKTMESSLGSDIANILLQFFREKIISIANMTAVCCDGEPKNTGKHNGVLRCLEKHLGKPLHWFVCLIHFNELVFRHIFEKIEPSRTTGPTTSTVLIANAIENVDRPV